MQLQEIEKIRQLVKSSSLLSQSERQEWLILLDLMNDKQLWELKGILEGVNMEHEAWNMEQKAGEINQKSRVRSQKPLVKSSELKAEMPALHHILNMPKGAPVFPQPAAISYAEDSSFSAMAEKKDWQALKKEKAESAGDRTGFWTKLKSVLAEKELPAGHPEATDELELPAPRRSEAVGVGPAPKNSQNAPAMAKPLAVPRPQSSAAAAPAMAGLESGKLLSPYPPQQIQAASLGHGEAGKREVEGKPAFARVSAFAEASADKPEDKFFVAGLKDTRILMNAKFAKAVSKEIRPLEQSAKQAPNFASAKKPAASGDKPANISNLEDLAVLSLRDVGRLSAASLELALKNLVKQFGYHRAAFALEKSPAFNSYLNTGLMALAGKYELDSGEYRIKTSDRYLNKADFEKFVDMLRAIKN